MIDGRNGKPLRPHRVKSRLADGSIRYYYYAYRGGPKFWACPHPPVDLRSPPVGFWEARNALVEAERARPEIETIADLVDQLEHSDAAYKKLAQSTRATYAVYFREVVEEFGDAEIDVFADRRIRKQIIAWRDRFADAPRGADYRVAALSRVLKYAVDTGRIEANHASGISNLYDSDRADIIWTEDDIDRWMEGDASNGVRAANQTERDIITHARFTGLRRTDLANLTRLADRGDHLVWNAVKGRKGKRVEVIIPIVPEYRAYLDAVYARQSPGKVACLNLITNRSDKPITPNGIGQAVRKRCRALGIDKHLHDLRGTFATDLMRAGFLDHEIAEIVGWTSTQIRSIRRRYVDRKAIVKAGIARLADARNKNRTVK